MTGSRTTRLAIYAVRIAAILVKKSHYIFIDEVSTLACHDMYKISAQLAKALNAFDLPFGGMNIIFSGDFALVIKSPVRSGYLHLGRSNRTLTG